MRLSGRSGENMVRSVQKAPPLEAPIAKGPETLSLFIIIIISFYCYLFFSFFPLFLGGLGVVINSFSGKLKRRRFDGDHLAILPPRVG